MYLVTGWEMVLRCTMAGGMTRVVTHDAQAQPASSILSSLLLVIRLSSILQAQRLWCEGSQAMGLQSYLCIVDYAAPIRVHEWCAQRLKLVLV